MTDDRLSSFTRNGLRFDVTDSGPLDGPVVVLLHGFPGSRRTWDAVRPVLNAGGVRSVAFDQRGYSAEARPRRRRDYRPEDITRDLLALIDALGAPRVHLVGHDWGGFVAWRAAAVAPERLSGMTVLSTPHPRALARAVLSSAQGMRSAYIAFFQLPGLPERVLRPRLMRLLRGSGVPRPMAEEYVRRMSERRALTSALHWYRGMWLPDRRARRAPHRVRVDTTYVWGNGDPALGRRAAQLTERYVDAPYRFVELDEGHWLPERAAQRVTDEILASLDLPGR